MICKVLFLALVVGCIAAGTSNDVEKDVGGRIPLPVPSTTPKSNGTTSSTTIKPNPSPTTTPPTTSIKPPTTTPNSTTTTATTTTTTTTPKPTTTPAPAPTPSPTPNTTTTAKPTSPPPPPTTTAKPNPTPIPPQPKEPIPGTWSVNYTDTNRTCVVITLAAQIVIPYNISKTINNTGYINITPNATTAIGTCGNLLQSITLQWNNSLNVTNNVTFTFHRTNVNSTKFDLALINVAIAADNSSLPGYNGTFILVENKPLFNTSLEHSYKCFKRQTFNLTKDQNSNVTAGFIHLQHVQLQAFRNTTGTVFAEAEDCAPRETPDVVPIAVGCALIALIIIVLAAYLIGRRRNQARGYLSMFNAEKKEEDYIPMKNLNCFK